MPRPSIADERRPQILAAATRAIAEYGFDGVRLSDVAGEAGVAIGTIQHYFDSRDDLLVAAFQEDNRRSVERARLTGAGRTEPWERIVVLADWVTSLPRWELWLEYWAVAARRADLRQVIAAAYEEWRAPVVEAVRDGVAAGDFRPGVDPEMVGATFVALADGLGIQRTLGTNWVEPDQAGEVLLGAIAALVFP